MDVKIGTKAPVRIEIGLFGDDAPKSVESFIKVCNSDLRGRGGRTVGYAYSSAWRIVRDERIDMGRVKQIDEINQAPGTPQRQIIQIEVPENRDVNDIAHTVVGTVSQKRGGGRFEFTITPCPLEVGSQLDEENIVIGRVVSGLDVVEALNQVPTNQKTARDGFRNIGKAIGDGRAKMDVSLHFPILFPTRQTFLSHGYTQETRTQAIRHGFEPGCLCAFFSPVYVSTAMPRLNWRSALQHSN